MSNLIDLTILEGAEDVIRRIGALRAMPGAAPSNADRRRFTHLCVPLHGKRFACIAWNGKTDRQGYGIFHYRAHRVAAHRFAIASHLNLPVGAMNGIQFENICGLRTCIVPAHWRPRSAVTPTLPLFPLGILRIQPRMDMPTVYVCMRGMSAPFYPPCALEVNPQTGDIIGIILVQDLKKDV